MARWKLNFDRNMVNEYVTKSDKLHTRVLKIHAGDLPNLYGLFETNPGKMMNDESSEKGKIRIHYPV